MKTAPIIYTDEDVRPDLLTAEERKRFPEQLDNNHRRQILDITRLRIDSVDYHGKPILSADEWLDKYFGSKEPDYDKLADELTKGRAAVDVVIPHSGVVIPVDRGIADIVQRLMDRGLVIHAETSRSGMITDNPNLRWIHEEPSQNISGNPGEFIYKSEGEEGMRVHFLTDNTQKYYNDAQAVALLYQAAEESGLILSNLDKGGHLKQCLELTMPYLMDGTGFYDCIEEARQNALKTFTGKGIKDGWVQAFRESKAQVVAAHGGYAKFTDNMIQDRLSRFERAVQRHILQNPDINQKVTSTIHYDDFLNGEQQEVLRKKKFNHHKNLWDQRAMAHIYSRYNETPDKVDQVARWAGYSSYKDYALNRTKTASAKDGERWATFQKLEKKHLTVNEQGMLKMFRIGNGVSKEAHEWTEEEGRKMAFNTVAKYCQCGYPINKLNKISIVMNNDNTSTIYAYVNDKLMARNIHPNDMARLLCNATTPFEIGLNTFANELGWKEKLNVDVSQNTMEILQLQSTESAGRNPITHDGQVYKVDDNTYDHAYLLTRIEQMPPNIRHAVFQIQPPIKNLGAISYNELKERVGNIQHKIHCAVSEMKVLRVDNDKFTLSCKIDGKPISSVQVKMEQLDFKEKFLPGMSRENLTQEVLADYHYNAIFRDESITSRMKR